MKDFVSNDYSEIKKMRTDRKHARSSCGLRNFKSRGQLCHPVPIVEQLQAGTADGKNI